METISSIKKPMKTANERKYIYQRQEDKMRANYSTPEMLHLRCTYERESKPKLRRENQSKRGRRCCCRRCYCCNGRRCCCSCYRRCCCRSKNLKRKGNYCNESLTSTQKGNEASSRKKRNSIGMKFSGTASLDNHDDDSDDDDDDDGCCRRCP